MSGGKSSKATVGYWYRMGLHFGICHGPVDALAEIKVGDRTCWDTEVTGSTTIYINEPKLFGGEKREGGIQGYADVLGGTSTQGVNSYLQEKIGADARVPAYRGLFALVYKGGYVSANNPYIKPWAFKVRRINEGWGEYGTEEVTEETTDYLPDWQVGTADPRIEGYTYEYRYGSTVYATEAEAVAAAEADLGYSLAKLPIWRRRRSGENPSEPSPLDPTVDGGNDEFVNFQYVDAVSASYLDTDLMYTEAEWSAAGGNGAVSPFGGIAGLGIPLNTYFYINIGEGRIAYLRSAGDVEVQPRPTASVRGWVAGNNCIEPSCPLSPTGIGGNPGVAQLFFRNTTDIGVRRVPTAPVLDGTDLPDWPEDPANYWWNEDTGEIYSKEPYVETAGSYRWLSKLSVTGGGLSTVQRKPLGPVLEVGDPNDTEAFWTAAYNAAVTAGTLPAGMTYNASGTGGITTYPRNETYAWIRTYNAIVPPEPPDPGLAQIGDDMNPAHIVRQCITNQEWGMGFPDALIGTSFTTVAQQLYDEEFGLSFQWTQQQPVEEFIGEVMNHVGGVWYADPRTGLFELALIRDDYSVSDLRVFDESNILAVESYQKPGYGELVNQIVVAWTDVPNNKTATTPPVQDSACIQAQGSVIAETRQYPGITKAALAQRVALRDLTAASTPLAALRLKVNREAWDLVPGKDVIVVSWQKLGLVQLVCRVLKVDRGTLEDGAITLEVAEDVFGLPDAVYTTQEPQEWEAPDTAPQDVTAQALVESPYWDLARNLSAADLDYTDLDSGYVFTLAARNTATETAYNIWSRTGSSDYEERGAGAYAPTALLNGAIDQQATTINLDGGVDLDDVSVGDRVLIGDGALAEFCEVLSLNTTTGVMTVNRAVLDTTPQEHADNTRVWFVENAFGVDPTERVLSDEVDVKLTALAPAGESELEDATEQTITIDGRFGKPYPPGRIRISGQAFPEEIDIQADASEGFVVTWTHRDRTQQDVELVTQNAGDIGPEPGTTYTAELYDDATDELHDSVSGITGTSVQMTALDTFQGRLEVYSVNDGRESWQRQVRRFLVIGSDYYTSQDGEPYVSQGGQVFIPE